MEVAARDVRVGGGVAAALFSYFPSHRLELRTLDQVLKAVRTDRAPGGRLTPAFLNLDSGRISHTNVAPCKGTRASRTRTGCPRHKSSWSVDSRARAQ